MHQGQIKKIGKIGASDIESKYIKIQNEKRSLKIKNSIYSYRKPKDSKQFIPSLQILNPDDQYRKKFRQKGQQVLLKKIIAVVIFAGGYGCRSYLYQSKQFKKIKWQDKQTDLFNITLQSLKDKIGKNQNMVFYVICSRLNSAQVIKRVEQIRQIYPQLSIYVAHQKQYNVLDFNGTQSVMNGKGQNLKYPGGIGALKDAIIHYQFQQNYSFAKHITDIIKPNYVYCIGTSNCLEKGINLQMLGLIQEKNLNCVFKCNYLKDLHEQLDVVAIRQIRQHKPAWLVMAFKNLVNFTKQQINNYPVWLDNFVFNAAILDHENEQYKIGHSQSSLKYQYHDRKLKNKTGGSFDSKIPQLTISYAIMKNKEKCIGYVPGIKQEQVYFLKTQKDFEEFSINIKSKSPIKKINKQKQ